MAFFLLALVFVSFGGQYLVFRAIGRRELRRRYAEAILAAQLEAESWAQELERELSEAA
jgi:hypothetical protein